MVQVSTAIAKTAALAMLAATSIPLSASAQQATTVAAPGAASAVMQLSAADCRVFAGIATDVMKSIGREKLSDEFVRGMIDFAVNKKCTGPYSIPARHGRDSDAFGTIDGILGSNKIMLDKIGVRAAKPVATLSRN
jgi:hypothetical protein